ncbi:MAG: flagellar biosynthesis anti-sigma factor FlgM [Venatoribacter sp.]
MDISKLMGGLNSSSRTRTEPVVNEKSSSKTKQETVSSGDQVKLSAGSKSIQQVEAEIRSMPEVNDALVDRIRTAIENGEYKIDYDKLAGKMLDFEDRLN